MCSKKRRHKYDIKPAAESGDLQAEDPPKKRLARYAPFLILVTAVFLVYFNALSCGFVWDDELLVEKNPQVTSLSNVPKVMTGSLESSGPEKFQFFRPVQTLSYMADFQFWGFVPGGYHFTNIILHFLVACLVYLCILFVSRNEQLALLSALFFAVHPVHAGAVTYIAGRADLLAAAFLLGGFYFFMKYCDGRGARYAAGLSIAYALALLSRESALVFVLILPAYALLFRKKGLMLPLAAAIAITGIYFWWRLAVVGVKAPHLYIATTLAQRTPGCFAAIFEYAKMLVLPFGLHMEYGNKLFSFTDPKVLAGAVIACGGIVYACFGARKNPPLGAFAFIWAFLTLLPNSNLYPINAYMAEHWIYVPSMGFFAVFAGLVLHFTEGGGKKAIRIFLAAAIVAFFGILTIRQNTYWRDPLVFFERTIKYAPDSARLYNALGVEYEEAGRAEESIKLFQKALSLEAGSGGTYSNLCRAYGALGRYKEAVEAGEKAVELEPRNPDVFNNLGIAYGQAGDGANASIMFKKAIAANPNVPKYHGNLGNAYETMGKDNEAIEEYGKAIQISPNYAPAHLNLAYLYLKKGDLAKASARAEKAEALGLKADPRFWEVLKRGK